jgi:hypothetical protein
MTDQFIGATPGYVAIVVTHFTDGREPQQRSAPIIGWRATDTGCNEHEIVPVFLGEQADQTSRDFMYYVGIVQPDGRVWWAGEFHPNQPAGGEFYPDQSAFMSAVFAAETKRRAQIADLCRRQQEYVTYATAWIDALPNGDDGGMKRWLSEKSLRNAANVNADDREALMERLNRKCDVFPTLN